MAAALPHSPSQHVVVSGRIIGTHSQPSSHAAASSKLARARNVNADGTRKNVMLEFRGIDRARFKYLRFRCKDKPATHDFYTTLGMTLDWTVEQEMRTVSCYQFKTSSPRFNENSLWLLFDWQKPPQTTPTIITTSSDSLPHLAAPHPVPARRPSFAASSAAGAAAIPRPLPTEAQAPKGPAVAEKMKKHECEYLVIYVHFLARVTKRMAKKGFPPTVPPTLHSDLKFSVLTDPNGLQIRLLELPEPHQLPDPPPPPPSSLLASAHTAAAAAAAAPLKDWFARLGYYVLPVVQLERVVETYAAMFSTKRKGGKAEQAKKAPTVVSGVGAGTKGKGETREGFQVVDGEEVVMGLTRHSYVFASSSSRADSCCLCFYEKLLESEHLDRAERDPDAPLVGVGFEVPNLEAAQTQLRKEFPEVLEWKQEYVALKDVGFYSRFSCLHTPLLVELFSVHGRLTKAVETHAPTLKERLGNRDPRVELGWTVDYARLGGMARGLSEASMVRVRRSPEEVADRWGEDETAWERWKAAEEDEGRGWGRKRRASF